MDREPIWTETISDQAVAGILAAPTADSLRPRFMVIGANLLKINLETGEVTAPSIEAASEAGRVFVESIRHYLRQAVDIPPRPK